jgi:hypothetical protein
MLKKSEDEGWYADEELALLERVAAARSASPAAFLEVGVFKGRSAAVLSKHTDHLVLVDTLAMGDFRAEWPKHERYFASVDEAAAGVGDIALLHQDADHSFLVVTGHLRVLAPKVIRGGVICLHDYNSSTYPGVRVAWQYWRGHRLDGGKSWKQLEIAGTLVCFERL